MHVTKSGFTIVELLIVIVIIAILATITTVAYNGLQTRARTAAAQTLANQTSKKVMAYYVTNSSYPADLATADVTDTTNLQYSVNNSANPATYCLTATSGNISYYISSTQTSPTSGGCPGHGQGGVPAITNLAANPSAESNTTDWTATYGTGGAGSLSRVTTGGFSGIGFGRATFSTAPTNFAGMWVASNAYVTSGGGKTYTATGYVRTSWSGATFTLNLVPYNSSWTYLGGEVYGSNVTIPANTWTRVSVSMPSAPANTTNFTLRLRMTGGTLPGVGATLDGDAVMLTEGTAVPNYADGSSTNWVWNGITNNSSSTGPAL